MLRSLLQPGQGFGVALLQQSVQHVLHGYTQGLSSRPLCSRSSNTSKDVQYHNMELQAAAIREIEQLLLPAGTLERTFKGCRVNLGFCDPKGTLYLPLNVKAVLMQGQHTCFNTRDQSQLEELDTAFLLLCRPFPSRGETLIASCSTFPKRTLYVTLREGLKYHPYLVPDHKLAEVVGHIYEAVRDGKEDTARLPSGEVIDISRLRLKAADELAIPNGPTNKRAREFYALRGQWLPALDIQPPYTVLTPVDGVVEGIRLADTVASSITGRQGYRINLHRRCLEDKKQPLREGDFDVLWVYHPDNVHFWLIPAHVLVEKGTVATGLQPGKIGFALYDNCYTKPQRRKGAELWTQQYLLDSRDPGLMEKVMQVLKAAK